MAKLTEQELKAHALALREALLNADAQTREAVLKADPAFDSALRAAQESKWTPVITAGIIVSAFSCGVILGVYLL